jgi:sphingomyelin phosphodiesterase
MTVFSVVRDSAMTSRELCAFAFSCENIKNPSLEWNITLPNYPKPPVVPPKPPKPDAKKLRILHLTDIHIDFEYQPGSLADCGQPLCCRNSSTPTFGSDKKTSSTKLAGFWGHTEHTCDVPFWTVENMFDHISKNEDFDFVYWTGDLPPHNVWNQTRDDQLYAYDKLTQLFQKYFPNKAIYPTLGNHEAQPCNLYPPPYVKEDNINWLYSAIAKEWTKTGLPSYLSANITRGAFYSINIFPKLRLISMNTNYCPQENFWLFINATDPLGQLEWLANTLQECENNGEKAHIIGHIPTDGCLESWSFNYYKIINRYENVVTAQMFGHSHKDEIRLFFDPDNTTRAVSVMYLGPGTTTTTLLNPGYRIYTLDGNYDESSWQIIDHETRFLNITEANALNKTRWQFEYSAKSAYGLENFFPQDWANLVDYALKNLDSPLTDKLLK